jgi:hypothetical protein
VALLVAPQLVSNGSELQHQQHQQQITKRTQDQGHRADAWLMPEAVLWQDERF